MATKNMCLVAFQALATRLNSARFPSMLFKLTNEESDLIGGLFVTWTKCISASPAESEDDWELRGCIGTFASNKMSKILAKYAITAAMEDTRFEPIERKELKDLRCSVSVLGRFIPTQSLTDWEVGKHGVYFILKDPESSNVLSSTFLPEVAEEQGWSKEETLRQLMRKAGCSPRLFESLKSHIELYKYETTKEHLTYSEFVTLYDTERTKESGDRAAED